MLSSLAVEIRQLFADLISVQYRVFHQGSGGAGPATFAACQHKRTRPSGFGMSNTG